MSYGHIYLHSSYVDGQDREEEKDLQKEVRQQSDDSDECELLYCRRESEKSAQEDQHPRHERLKYPPPFLTDACKYSYEVLQIPNLDNYRQTQ